jgi:hypothetical protein
MMNANEKFVARISEAIPAAEADMDTAMASVANLMATLAISRKEADVPAATGQATLVRLAKAQLALVDVSSEILRVHKELFRVGQEVNVGDLHEDCKSFAQAPTRHLAIVS